MFGRTRHCLPDRCLKDGSKALACHFITHQIDPQLKHREKTNRPLEIRERMRETQRKRGSKQESERAD